MEAIPLCDIIEVYINIYLRLYTTIFHNSNYNCYLVVVTHYCGILLCIDVNIYLYIL